MKNEFWLWGSLGRFFVARNIRREIKPFCKKHGVSRLHARLALHSRIDTLFDAVWPAEEFEDARHEDLQDRQEPTLG